jgi:hypothetical protein
MEMIEICLFLTMFLWLGVLEYRINKGLVGHNWLVNFLDLQGTK